MKLIGLTIGTLGVNGQLIPGLNLLPSFVVNPIITQVKNTAESIVGGVFPNDLPLNDVDGNPISTTDFFANIPDDAFIELLSSEKTSDPLSWDSDFLNTVLDNQNLPVDDYINKVESITTGLSDVIDPELFAEIGISDLSDLTGENVRAAIEKVVENNPDLEQQLYDTLGGESEFNDFVDNVETGLNTVDLSDDFWTDPSQWDEASISAKLTDLESLGIPANLLDTLSSGLADAGSQGLLSGGLSLDGITSDFGQCLDVIETAKSMVYFPKLSEIVGFSWADFGINIVSLLNDGLSCYSTYLTMQGNNTTSAYFEYGAYALMAVEKTIRVFDQIPDVKADTTNLVSSFYTRLEVLDRYTEISYLEYAEQSASAARFLLNHQFLDLVNEVVGFYNMLVDDVPVVELYYIRSSDITDVIEYADWLLTVIEREIDFIHKIGGEHLEKLVLQKYFPDAAIETDNSGGSIFDIFGKGGQDTTTQAPLTTTTPSSNYPSWLEEIIRQFKAILN